MIADLVTTAHPHRIQSTMGLEASIEPLNTRSPVVDGLPLIRLDRCSDSLLMGRIGVYDGLRTDVSPDDVSQAVARIGRVENDEIGIEPCIA